MSTDDSLDTRPLKRRPAEVFETIEQKGLYRLATHATQYSAVAREALTLLEKFTAFMGESEKARLTGLRKQLDELTEEG